MKKILMKSAAMALIATMLPLSTGQALPTRTQTFYAISAHPDDEFAAMSMLENRPDRYTIFVTMTLGEGTRSCLSAEDANTYEQTTGHPAGPYRYEGPNSPVGRPDKGERHPLGDPWQGWMTDECARARIASWHWFLDDMSEIDPSLPNFGISSSPAGDPYVDGDYRGAFCLPNSRTEGNPGQPEGNGSNDHSLGCAQVWANQDGARVAFNLGDRRITDEPLGPRVRNRHPLTPDKVIAAIEALRANRGAWGITALPENGLLAAAMHEKPEDCSYLNQVSLGYDEHLDHGAVQDALYNHNFGAGPQYGVTCGSSPRYRESPGVFLPPTPIDYVHQNKQIFGVRYLGAAQVNYGWLFDDPWDLTLAGMYYWRRFG